MKILIFVSCTILLTAGVGGHVERGFLESLEEFLEDQVTSIYFPQAQSIGLGLTVANANGSLSYTKGFGFRDLESNSMANENSLFCIGSITKSVTSSLIVKILSEKFPQFGDFVVEMPIQKLAETLNVTLSDRYRSESVSFRDLTSHRSCLTSHLMGPAFGAVTSFEDYIYRTRYESEACPFRTSWLYNNAMYGLAGHLIGEIAGDSYENLLRNFLDEIGMKDSKLPNLEGDYNSLENMMQGYYINKNGILTKADANMLRQVSMVAPAGALLSTAKDMAKYISFHLNLGQVDGRQVVSTQAMKWIQHPAIHVADSQSYGMGFSLDPVAGSDPFMRHGGYWPPYSSYLSISPSQKIGVFTSSAGPSAIEPQTEQLMMHDRILSFLQNDVSEVNKVNYDSIKISQVSPLSFPFPTKIVQQEELANSKLENSKAVCTPSDVTGLFGSGISGQMEIYENEGNLKIRFGYLGDGNLSQLDADCKFEIEWIGLEIAVILYKTMDGSLIKDTLEFQRSEVTQGWDSAQLVITGEGATMHRNLTIEILPQVPYDPNSCVADNFYGF